MRRSIMRLLLALCGAALLAAPAGCGPREGERWLAARRYAEVLARVRPSDARGHRLHGAALLGLGRIEAARRALRISLVLDGASAPTLELLAEVERRRQRGGAAFRLLQRLFDERPRALSPAARRQLERYRALSGRWRAAGGGRSPTSRELAAAGLRPCAGAPSRLPLAPPPLARGCHRRDPFGAIARLEAHDLQLSCNGVALAQRLEREGCLAASLELWRRLAQEAPGDARWLLQVGRLELTRGRPAAARSAFEQHAFRSRDRAAGCLQVADVLLAAGRRAAAGRWAVQALALARDGATQLRCLRSLRRAGQEQAAREAGRVILHERPALQAAVRAALSERP